MSSYEIMYCLLLSLSLSHTHPFSLSLSLTLFLAHTLSLFAYLSASIFLSLSYSLSIKHTLSLTFAYYLTFFLIRIHTCSLSSYLSCRLALILHTDGKDVLCLSIFVCVCVWVWRLHDGGLLAVMEWWERLELWQRGMMMVTTKRSALETNWSVSKIISITRRKRLKSRKFEFYQH